MSKQVSRLISEALAIEAEEAKEAGALGFMARALVQATIPHRSTTDTTFTRTNGAYKFTMSNPSGGLPYGTVPRLLLAWLATEAVTTKQRELVLGNSLSDFMRQLDMVPTGGRWGSITRLKNQSHRLFSSFIQCSYTGTDDTVGHHAIQNMVIVDSVDLWWEPKEADQKSLFNSTVTLSQPFYNEIIDNPVPIDLRALKVLKQSPMALDIYCWLSHRMGYLKKSTCIPWEGLQNQFGAGYPMTNQGKRDFKKKFLLHLRKVLTVYPDARASEGVGGLLIRPSKTHIPKSFEI